MTRRITWTLLVLTSVLLVLAVVPLAVSLTARERVAYRDSQRAATRVIAAAAEEHLSDNKPPTVMRRELDAAARAGDCAAVYDTSGRVVASTSCTAAQGEEAAELVKDVLAGHEPEPPENEGRLVAAEPAGEVHRPAGAVVLARSMRPAGHPYRRYLGLVRRDRCRRAGRVRAAVRALGPLGQPSVVDPGRQRPATG